MSKMTISNIQLAVMVFVFVDLLTVAVPLGSILLAIIVFSKPKWFKDVVDSVYNG